MSCEGKVVVVTGGSVGYGRGIAAKLAARGARVFITARREEPLRRAAEELGVTAIVADVTRPADWDRVFERAGAPDVLVNNAGAGVHIAPLAETSDDDIARSIAVNLTGPLYGCRRAAAAMAARKRGLIINISSICAHYGWPGFVAYSAAKAGLDMMGRTLYTELRPSNVRVTTITPSWGDTEFGVAAKEEPSPDELRAKMMTPEQMGDLVVQVCEFPEHLVFPEIRVQPVEQELIPF